MPERCNILHWILWQSIKKKILWNFSINCWAIKFNQKLLDHFLSNNGSAFGSIINKIKLKNEVFFFEEYKNL